MSNETLNLRKSISPTSEAKAYTWESLCPGTQKALTKIFYWLNAACESNQRSKNSEMDKLADKYESPSTSILVSGDRGSGKTTVLLSAAYAYNLAKELKGDFFRGADEDEVNDLKNILSSTHQKVFWLDTLDLEPLHPNTNLLASILVRVRLAIEDMDHKSKSSRPHSILEGDAGTGEKLNRLINDATFMWEALAGSSGPGAERSENQITAAEKSANFEKEFKDIMEDITTLVRDRGRQQTELFLLPIDNVDRSIEHIANISKLIRLATSRRIWFILAAVRPEYQLFLERSFQKELRRSGTSSDVSSWDQTQAIARRQAATQMRRALPENYQIRIEPLTPYQAWTFPLYYEKLRLSQQEQTTLGKKDITMPTDATKKESTVDAFTLEAFMHLKSQAELGNVKELIDWFCKSINQPSSGATDIIGLGRDVYESIKGTNNEVVLENLLDEIILPPITNTDKDNKKRFQTFKDLFNITSQLDENARNKYLEATKFLRSSDDKESSLKEIFSGAGKMALNLSMRTLQDFKSAISLYKVKNSECAVEVAALMLRNAIDESNLPFWASKLLLDQIIRKDSNDKWVLDLSNNPIGPFKQQKQFSELSYPIDYSNESVEFIIEEKLQYQEFPDVVLELKDTADKYKKITLQPVVAGWFMILHDILVLYENTRVYSEPSLPHTVFSNVVQNSHKLLYKKKRNVELLFEWKRPEWPTFIEHFLCAVQWTAILNTLKNTFDKLAKKTSEKTFVRTSETTSQGDENSDENRIIKYRNNAEKVNQILHLAWIDNICSVSGENLDNWKCYNIETLVKTANSEEEYLTGKEYSHAVQLKLCKLVEWSREHKFDTRKSVAWRWLSRELPLLIGPEYSLLIYQNKEPKYTVPEIFPKEIEKKHLSPEKQPEEYWDNLYRYYWKDYCIRLVASREEIVRESIKKSEAYKSCSDPDSFVRCTTNDWFSTIWKFHTDIPLVKKWDTWDWFSHTFSKKGE